jgi:DNA-directed RNA polymerase subunit RPC12/RpoP
MTKKLVCSECGKETESLIAGRCLKCNKEAMQKQFLKKYFKPKKKRNHTLFLGTTKMGMSYSGPLFAKNFNQEFAKKKRNKCKRCGTFCYGEYCWKCFKKIEEEQMQKAILNERQKQGQFIGLCKVCREKVHGKDGTFMKGKGSCHKKCAEAKQKIKELVKET